MAPPSLFQAPFPKLIYCDEFNYQDNHIKYHVPFKETSESQDNVFNYLMFMLKGSLFALFDTLKNIIL